MEQEEMQCTDPLEQHVWLQRLVGNWSVTATMNTDEGTETWKSNESIRSLGAFWIVAESTADGFGSLMMLGYDPKRKSFVGTWADSLQPTLWSYRGTLEASGDVLILEAEGPSFADPTQTCTYRDCIELIDPDQKVTRSFWRDPDGNWVRFMTMEARRIG